VTIRAANILVEREREDDAPGFEADAEALLAALELEEAELSVVFCTDARIAELNAAWRGVEGPTDVLSFPQDDAQLLGDLVISLDTADRQAKERCHGLQDELRILLLHGLLHLLGFDHELDPAAHEEMAAKESELMGRLGWRGTGLISQA
jgi:rRNA maturation RNase YbeY